ncbi:MAG: hypothetical protein ACLQVM_12770 [Terriglobia bacterium]
MPIPGESESLHKLLDEIELFIKSLRHPVVVEDEVELFDLSASHWRLSVEFGKLIFAAWNAARSVSRRVEDIAYRDGERLGVFARKPGGREITTMEFRELDRANRQVTDKAPARASFQKQLLSMLSREYPGYKFERVSHRSDREHSFSAWYTRGVARLGRTAWAFLGLGEGESPAAADAALAFGLIWLDWLRSRSDRVIYPGLKLIFPPQAAETSAHRAACLNHRAVQVEILEWSGGEERPRVIDWRDYGNVETRLAPCRLAADLVERHRGLFSRLLGERLAKVDVIADPLATALSIRVLGLEVARVEGLLSPRITFGLPGNARRLEEGQHAELRQLLETTLSARCAASPNSSSDPYRLQSERWLESMVVRDVTKLDPALLPTCIYPQVPAFSGMDRGVIDILLATRSGRLAVLELKVQEDINLPLQGLDYWLRVKWLQERGQFQRFGYFPGIELADAAPLVYLVSPAFRFHSTTGRMLRYLDPAIRITQVGINDSWREDIKVLFRREYEVGA